MSKRRANRIAAVMAARRLSATETARALGISRTTLWRWTRGDMSPGVERAQSLARLLDVTLDELFSVPVEFPTEPECQ